MNFEKKSIIKWKHDDITRIKVDCKSHHVLAEPPNGWYIKGNYLTRAIAYLTNFKCTSQITKKGKKVTFHYFAQVFESKDVRSLPPKL